MLQLPPPLLGCGSTSAVTEYIEVNVESDSFVEVDVVTSEEAADTAAAVNGKFHSDGENFVSWN